MTTSKPWDNEPDFLEDEFCDLKYEIKRNLDTGSLCGYIIIPPGNAFNKAKSYDDEMLSNIDVHGGWTYMDQQDDNLVIGFDCAHYGDLIPMMELMMEQLGHHDRPEKDQTYRDIKYVENQCKRACWLLAGNSFTDDLNEALYQRYANGE